MQKLRTLAVAASCAAALFITGAAQAAKVTVDMHRVTADGVGKDLGTISFKDTDKGLEIQPRLMGLQEGLHAFQLDAFPSCATRKQDGVKVPALGAGQPYDPNLAGLEGKGKPAGDLPGLYVNYGGDAYSTIVAPNLKTADLEGHSIVIDALGPAYKDAPKPIDGMTARVACGVVSMR